MYRYFAAPAFAAAPFRQPALAPVLANPPEGSAVWQWLEEANFLSRAAYGCGSASLVFRFWGRYEAEVGEIVPGEEEWFFAWLAEQPGGEFALQRTKFAL